MSEKRLVSVIIPTKNRPKQLKRLIDSVKKSEGVSLEIIVINDGGSELSVLDQGITLLHNEKNKGLAYSRTLGAKKSHGKYILFIDDDNIVDPQMISILVESLESHPELVAVGPITFYASNKNKIWFVGSKLNLSTSMPTFYRSYTRDQLIDNELFVTENLHNCFMVREELGREVDWFDEEVFMNGTEFDLFQRIKRRHPDKRLATNVKVYCYHDVPEYSKDFLRSMGFDNERRVYYFQRNRGLHVSRNGTFYQKLSLFFIFYPLFFLGYSLLFLVKGKPSFVIQHLRATVAGYGYLMRKY